MKMRRVRVDIERYWAGKRAKALGLSLSDYVRHLIQKDLGMEPPGKQVAEPPAECFRCDGSGWVCEGHPDLPWEGPRACGCGAPGDPCPECNELAGETPRLPAGTRTVFDKDGGWRH